MAVTFRQYTGSKDYERINNFLIKHYQEENQDGNWFQPTWEYMHNHSYLDSASLHKIRVWEDRDDIVAVAHYESQLGEAFFQVHPDYGQLKTEMLDYAEGHLLGTSGEGKHYLQAYVNDFDDPFIEIVKQRGYELKKAWSRPISQFIIPDSFPAIPLPDGFKLKSLADDNNLMKLHRVLHRGFNHEGEPPEEGLAGRRQSQLAPSYRKDLKIVVEAPDGQFVSFCGMWYEPVNRLAYVEPVATDPDYRRMGLGRAAVWEGIRRCGELGANVAYVGSDQVFYMRIGFRVLYESHCWIKDFNTETTTMCPEAYT